MADIVRVSTEQANASNQALGNNLQEAKRLMGELKAIVEETRTWWEGETTNAFIDSFSNGVTVFNNYLDKLQQHGNAMVKSVANQQQHDAGLARNIRKF